METKQTYISPQSVIRAVCVHSVVCASALLTPLPDDNETIEWDD